jgi:predicted nuclease of predicted toxin-antitoxin system
MKILIDMNLSPKWVAVLEEAGRQAIHWSSVGPQNAPDHEILSYAKSKGYVVFTHDLDFGAILAATKADCPSVIQVRTQDVSPQHLSPLVLSALSQFEAYLEEGALVTVDEKKSRARILPLGR